jgi:hypothetical protein
MILVVILESNHNQVIVFKYYMIRSLLHVGEMDLLFWGSSQLSYEGWAK